jgi:hypothetical protein
MATAKPSESQSGGEGVATWLGGLFIAMASGDASCGFVGAALLTRISSGVMKLSNWTRLKSASVETLHPPIFCQPHCVVASSIHSAVARGPAYC